MDFKQNIDLQSFNTFGLSEKASYYFEFTNISELKWALSNKPANDLMILGGGSNILLTQPIDALVLKNNIKGITVENLSEEEVLVTAGAGETWHELVLFCIKEGYGGIENMSLIPGSVGAAPMQNIGAYGVEIKDVFDHLNALKIEDQSEHIFDNNQCQFGYRESVFKRALKNQFIITSVSLKLTKKNHQLNTSYGAIEKELTTKGIEKPTIKDVSDAVIAIRQSKLPDPKKIGNSGSFFKNPVISKDQFKKLQEAFPDIAHYPIDEEHEKIAAGWLIDKAGWKGKTFGNYGVHKNQALVLVNYGGANGQDIYQLSEQILKDIKSKFGIDLEREVNIL